MKISISFLIVLYVFFFTSCCGEREAKLMEFGKKNIKSSIITCFQEKNFKALLKNQKDKKKTIWIATDFHLIDTVAVNNEILFINARSNQGVDVNPGIVYIFNLNLKYLTTHKVMVSIHNDVNITSWMTKFRNELTYEYKDGFWKLSKQESYIDD